ncbi:MAG: AAA family ATPase [Ignavibacteriales bacterium]|nr:AAA family ATPase [Ignavibacteriales bacterium]
MGRIFISKISSTNHPEQFEQNFYAGGKPESTWYGGIKVGDFVFPIFQQKISKLWRVTSFDNTPNSINPNGSARFEIIKTFQNPLGLASTFTRYKNFEMDLILLNKCVKSTGSAKIGFYEILCNSKCPNADQIDFSEKRSFYLANNQPNKKIDFNEGDIRILISNIDELQIEDIQIYANGNFTEYRILKDLYFKKNKVGERYSISELYNYAKVDNANNKEKFLSAAIDELKSNGIFSVTNPISLYDNLIVGRRRSYSKKKEITEDVPQDPTSDEIELTDEQIGKYKEYVDILKFSPNLILYGPPGTGKTYATERIIETFENYRTGEEKTFREIQEEGRVDFVTFHQSFSYEEFVEGLRPVVKSDIESEEQSDFDDLKYKVQDGLLKQIADKASLGQISKEFDGIDLKKVGQGNKIWKISLGAKNFEEEIYSDCIKSNTIAIGWLKNKKLHDLDYENIYNELMKNSQDSSKKRTNDASSIHNFVNKMQIGDFVLVFGSVTSIRAVGIIESEYYWDKDSLEKYPHRRKVQWIRIFDQPIDILRYNGNTRLTLKTVYELSRIKFSDIKEILMIGQPEPKTDTDKEIPFYLVIDEINRGNISKIFGELITLIEKDKRNKIKVKLPYSQSEFSLPSNLYIIGTMNSADRSIAILDTALRRRFIFKEIEPDAEIIKENYQYIDEDIDLAELLNKLNSKVTEKLDRDHRIGHSYFLDVYHLNQFKIIWYHQIIPLLMEYFYNDAEVLKYIIGESFIDKKTSQIKMIPSDEEFKKAILSIK